MKNEKQQYANLFNPTENKLPIIIQNDTDPINTILLCKPILKPLFLDLEALPYFYTLSLDRVKQLKDGLWKAIHGSYSTLKHLCATINVTHGVEQDFTKEFL